MSHDYHAILCDLGLDISDEMNATFDIKYIGLTYVSQNIPKTRMIVNINLPHDSVKQLILYEGQANSDAVFNFCQ